MKLRILSGAGKSALTVLSASERPGAAFEDSWRASLKKRVVVMVSFLFVWAAIVEGRFVYLQVVDHQELLTMADARQERVLNDKAKRGDIVDRNGQLLAYSVDVDTVIAVPTSIKDPAATTAAICRVFADCTKDVRATLFDRLSSNRPFQYVRRQITPEQAAAIAALKLDGIGLRVETKRFYPKKELAAHILGFTDIDNGGLAGIELKRDADIRGVDGQSLVQVDAKGRSVQSVTEEPAVPGATVELTIDEYIQYITERELQAGVERAGAKSGTAIVMDPMTGEVLAMASYPTFNPNAKDSTDEDRKNRAVQDVYEPGSTFKIVTASAAFQEGVFKLTDMVDTNPGRITIGSRKPITEAKGHNYGLLDFKSVIVKSSNVGAVKIGLKVGAERMADYMRRFGFGQLSLRDLPGESRGVVWDATKLSDSSLASMAMGYEVSVTPMQMVTAVSAVANGGILYQPHIVRATVDKGVRTPVAPKEVRRPINAETASEIVDIMEGVVNEQGGTGSAAKVAGYMVAGKTGTAAKLLEPARLGYSHTDYNCSFVGFVPSRNPKLAIIVLIDTPRKLSPYGGTVAAPVFSKIADAALRQLGVPRTVSPVPPVLVTTVATAETPVVNAPVAPVVTTASGESVVPDVVGMSAREATRVLTRLGLTTRIAGDGTVALQLPAAGAPLERGGTIALQLRRHGEPR